MTSNIIFVLSNGRTGSTLLCQALKNYQHTINFNEALFLTSNDLFYTDINFGNFLCNNIKIDMLSKNELKNKLLDNPIKLLTTISDYYAEPSKSKYFRPPQPEYYNQSNIYFPGKIPKNPIFTYLQVNT